MVKQYGVDPKKVHLIGHSLGAHGMGHAGRTVRNVLNKAVARLSGEEASFNYNALDFASAISSSS